MKKIKEMSNIIGLVGCGLIILGCFLPWVTVMGISINYIIGDGQFVVGLTIVAVILIILKKGFWELIPTIISCILFINTTSKMLMNVTRNFSVGFYLILIGLILTLIYPFLARKPKEQEKNEIV